LELIYSLLEWILSFNIVIISIFIYELVKMTKNYYKKKTYGGKKLETFHHKSGIKIFVAISFVLGTIFSFWMLKWGGFIGDAVIFQLYLFIIFAEGWRKIVVYENGIYHMGRFVDWEEMKSIKTNETSIRIEIKGSLFGMLVMGNVRRPKELIQLIEDNI